MIKDTMTAEGITKYLSELCIDSGIEVEVFPSVGSTNTICIERARAGAPAGYVAVACEQTGGRGRMGRQFYSPEGTGIYMSMLLRPESVPAERVSDITTMAAVAVCQAIETVCGKAAEIKWVNDVFVDGRKVCGILTEAEFNPTVSRTQSSPTKATAESKAGTSVAGGSTIFAVPGIGINVYEPEGGFPDEIKDTAGAIFSSQENAESTIDSATDSESGHANAVNDDSHYSYNAITNIANSNDIKNRLAAEVLNRFMEYYIEFVTSFSAGVGDTHFGWSDEYRRRCFVVGKPVTVIAHGTSRSAVATGLDERCHLIVRYDDGSAEVLSTGEISIRI